MSAFSDRLIHAWNAFMNKDPTIYKRVYGQSYTYRPDRVRLTRGNERSIVTAVFNRIALDVSQIKIEHVRLDDDGQFIEVIDSDLNNCLTVESNIDQTARSFKQDACLSMFDEGSVALVPIDTDIDIESGTFKIFTIRTGQIVDWYPAYIKVKVYNERKGIKEEVMVPKSSVAIIENPFYAVMNESNSTLQRLIRKLNLLDAIDEQSGAGKLDLIIQLPYVIKSEARRKQAESRRADIEQQLSGSKYGIAYTDGTEKITQLNRAVDNNLMKQIEYLTSMLYSQLGITQEIMNGTADANAMNNYYNRTIEPIMAAFVDEMKRKFLTKTARTQGQSINFFRDYFKLVSVTDIPEMVDKFTRNEVMTTNEWRAIMGMKPSNDPKADQLVNSNIRQPGSGEMPMGEEGDVQHGEQDQIVNELLDNLLKDVDSILGQNM